MLRRTRVSTTASVAVGGVGLVEESSPKPHHAPPITMPKNNTAPIARRLLFRQTGDGSATGARTGGGVTRKAGMVINPHRAAATARAILWAEESSSLNFKLLITISLPYTLKERMKI